MKANRLQKGTTIIELDRLELADLQEMLGLVQSYNSKKGKDQLKQRHYDFIKHLNLQLDGSQKSLLAVDKLKIMKDKLKDALRKSPDREKGFRGYYYNWVLGFNPEKDFGIKIDCRGITFSLSISSQKEDYNYAGLFIYPPDYKADSEYIKLDHQATVETALKGKSYLVKYLKDQILAYMAAKSGAVKS